MKAFKKVLSITLALMLAGLALGCDGLRVGLEDNIIYSRNADGSKVIATNVMLVERAVELAKMTFDEILGDDPTIRSYWNRISHRNTNESEEN